MRKLLALVALLSLVSIAQGKPGPARTGLRPWGVKVAIASVPDEIRSDRFTVAIDGHPASFAHAAANYYFLNFDLKDKAKIAITAPSDDYWAKGVEVQPWSLGIRPRIKGRTIAFPLTHPAK